MANYENISLEEALALLKQKDEEAKAAREEAKRTNEEAQRKAKEAKEARAKAKEAEAKAKALEKSRPAGVLVKLAESLLAMSKARLGDKLPAYGGSDAASLGKRTALCIEKGFTKSELLPVLLEALGKSLEHEDAPLHEATIHAQLPTRIQSRLEPLGVMLAKGRGEGQKEMRFLCLALPKKG